MIHSDISDLVSLLVWQRDAAYLTLILLSGTPGFAYSVHPYQLKQIPIVNFYFNVSLINI